MSRSFFAPTVLLVVLSSLAAASGALPAFYPAGQPLRVEGYDHWAVWRARFEVRATPTTHHTLLERHAALLMWLGDMRQRRLPVNEALPPATVSAVADLIKRGDHAAACLALDDLYRKLEAFAARQQEPTRGGFLSGKIVDVAGNPVKDARVTVVGSPLGAYSNEDGNFVIPNVPVSAPRYILRASSPGFIDGFSGGLTPTDQPSGAAVLLLAPQGEGSPRLTGTLAVRVCRMVELREVPPPPSAFDSAVVDMKIYPREVQTYLEPSPRVDSDNTAIVAQASAILASVAEPHRLRSAALVQATVQWLVSNIAYDSERSFPGDPACGNWQLVHGAWSRDPEDWLQLPSQVLETRRATCAEYERLTVALLRALNVPARTVLVDTHPVTQWWVQLSSGNGFWANVEAWRARHDYDRTGVMPAQLPSVSDSLIGFFSPNQHPPAEIVWDAANPCLWLADYGQIAQTALNPAGLKVMQRWMEQFKADGKLPTGVDRTVIPPSGLRLYKSYQVSTRGAVIDLSTLGAQRKLSVRFPVYVENQYRKTIDMQAWTDHPEWLKTVRRENMQDPVTRQNLDWYVLEFEIGRTAPVQPAPAG